MKKKNQHYFLLKSNTKLTTLSSNKLIGADGVLVLGSLMEGAGGGVGGRSDGAGGGAYCSCLRYGSEVDRSLGVIPLTN